MPTDRTKHDKPKQQTKNILTHASTDKMPLPAAWVCLWATSLKSPSEWE